MEKTGQPAPLAPSPLRNGLPILLVLLCAFLTGPLAACASLEPSAAPELIPTALLPTVIAQTAEAALRASWTPTPTTTPTPSPTPTATLVPLPTPTPTLPPPFPTAQIQILSPGPMSRISSPLTVRLRIFPADSMSVELNLYGENGRLLAQSRERFYTFSPRSGALKTVRLPFQLNLVAERATLQIHTDTRQGIIRSLITQPLLLLSLGDSVLTPPMPPFERLFLASPAPEAQILGGLLAIQGVYYPLNANPLRIELLTQNNELLSSQELPIPTLDLWSFSLVLPYQVTESTPAWISFSQANDRLPIPAYIYSHPILLFP
jgi:hypothetical protein